MSVNISIYAEVSALAEIINTSPISREKYSVLLPRVNAAFTQMQHLETQGKVDSLFQDLKERVIDLYKQLEEGLVKEELSKIRAGSLSLRRGRISQQAIHFIEKRVEQLEHNYSGSVEEKRIIAEAKQALIEAKARLKTRLENPPKRTNFKKKIDCSAWLSRTELPLEEAVEAGTEELLGSLAEIEELWELAEDIYYNPRSPHAKSRYENLCAGCKQMIARHLATLGATLFEDRVGTVQALMATVNEWVGNQEQIPTPEQLEQLFKEACSCCRTTGNKIVQLTKNSLNG